MLQASISAVRRNTPSPIINSPRQHASTTLLSPASRDDHRSYFAEPSPGLGERTRGADGEPAVASKSQPAQSVTLWAIADVVRARVQDVFQASVQTYQRESRVVPRMLSTSGQVWPCADVMQSTFEVRQSMLT